MGIVLFNIFISVLKEVTVFFCHKLPYDTILRAGQSVQSRAGLGGLNQERGTG